MYTRLGDGEVDVTAIVRRLIDSGYDGWFVLEQDVALADATADPSSDAAASFAYVKDVLATAGVVL
jgi:inosose dehydratase